MIAVISDSHIPGRAEEIPEEFLELVEKADEAVHCGDFETEDLYNELKQEYNIVGVRGNCDRVELPKYEDFEYSGVEFGVFHGTGISPRGHLPTLENIADQMDVDVLLTGHTHQQRAVKEGDKIILNPGSCTGVGGGSATAGNPEMMTVEVEDSVLKVELVELVDGEVEYETENFDL